jgi:hypothetical protein
MGNDKMREDFEAWAAENGMALHLARSESGLYVSPVTQRFLGCWVAAQARQVAEVEALRGVMAEILNQTEGNIRPTVRDCVNGIGDVQEIYGHCDAIEFLIGAVMSKEAGQ